jgi:hypothetical protein
LPRDADRAVRADGDHIERRIEAARVDEFGNELGEALLIVRRHAASLTERGDIDLFLASHGREERYLIVACSTLITDVPEAVGSVISGNQATRRSQGSRSRKPQSRKR